MFRFDEILERWATAYKPISHRADPTQKHTAFYRINTINADSQFVRNFAQACSPAMAYATLVDAHQQENNTVVYVHTIYFLVKQRSQGMGKTAIQDDMEATECKYMANGYVLDLLAFLRQMKAKAQRGELADKEAARCLRGFNLDTAEWATIPMKYNGWWICGLTLEQTVTEPQCIVSERYNEDVKTLF